MEDTSKQQLALFEPELLDQYEKGKDELNLAEYPLALAGKTLNARGNSKLTFTDVVRDSSNGRSVKRTVTVSGDRDLGLPTYYDEEVLFGVLQLTHLSRQHDGTWPQTVQFSRYQLAKLLGLDTSGHSYQRLQASLKRLVHTTYSFDYALFDKQDSEWVPGVSFHLLEEVEFGSAGEGQLGRVKVTWPERLYRNFVSGYLRDINFLEYRAMRLPLAKALFRFLGKHFYRKRKLSFDLRTLAHEKLGLSREYNIGQVKQALEPALRRLEERGFIVPQPREGRYEKVQKGVWRIHFELATPRELPSEPELVPTELERKLVDQGVSRSVAAELVADFPDEAIERKLDVLEWLDTQKQSPKTSRAGWLTKSIRDKWDDPQGFVSREERERKKAQEDEKRQRAVEKERERQKAEKAFDDASTKRERFVWSHFQKLDQADKDRITDAATKDDVGGFKKKHAKIFIIEHLAGVLEADGTIPALPVDPRKVGR